MPADKFPAVLLLGYNRPDHLARALESIYEFGQVRLYVFIDGPKKDIEHEQSVSDEVRIVVQESASRFDLRVNLSNSNLGGGRAFEEAIRWFFEHEEQGLIWEDDCVLHPSARILVEYLESGLENLSSVHAVSFANYAAHYEEPRLETFRWSRYHSSGIFWTQKSAWKNFDLNLSSLRLVPSIIRIWAALDGRITATFYWSMRLLQVKAFANSSFWDYQFALVSLVEGGSNIISNHHLVRNDGFSVSSSGRTYDKLRWIETIEIRPLPDLVVRPKVVQVDNDADFIFERRVLGISASRLIRLIPAFISKAARSRFNK